MGRLRAGSMAGHCLNLLVTYLVEDFLKRQRDRARLDKVMQKAARSNSHRLDLWLVCARIAHGKQVLCTYYKTMWGEPCLSDYCQFPSSCPSEKFAKSVCACSEQAKTEKTMYWACTHTFGELSLGGKNYSICMPGYLSLEKSHCITTHA